MFIFSRLAYEVGVWSFIWDSRQYIFIEQFIFFLFLFDIFFCIMIDKENLQGQQKKSLKYFMLVWVSVSLPPTGKNQWPLKFQEL